MLTWWELKYLEARNLWGRRLYNDLEVQKYSKALAIMITSGVYFSLPMYVNEFVHVSCLVRIVFLCLDCKKWTATSNLDKFRNRIEMWMYVIDATGGCFTAHFIYTTMKSFIRQISLWFPPQSLTELIWSEYNANRYKTQNNKRAESRLQFSENLHVYETYSTVGYGTKTNIL